MGESGIINILDEGNELCIIYIYIVILLSLKTVAIFSVTYTLQRLGKSLQKNEKLVTVYLAQPNFAPVTALEKYTCIWNTSFVRRHFKYKAHSDTRYLKWFLLAQFVYNVTQR
jgi:hypothetical protein